MTQKNIIKLFNNKFGFHLMSIVHPNEIFNRESMMNNLEAIQDKTFNYDDIVYIDICSLMDVSIIVDLPTNLVCLKIIHTTLDHILIPERCCKIKEIHISESNLEAVPEIHFLKCLKKLHITKSNISSIPSRFPDSIISIDLSGNSLNDNNTDLTKFPKNAYVLLFGNNFSKRDNPGICYGTQRIRKHTRITNYSLQREEARYIIDNAFLDIPKITVLQPTNRITVIPEQNILNSGQTVHISSICGSVSKSIDKIKILTNEQYKMTTDAILINEFMNEFYGQSHSSLLTIIIKYISLGYVNRNKINVIKDSIKSWVDCTSVHSKTNITYGELLARVWILIKNNKQKNDFIENVKIELDASIGVCFTGRINRLVNSLIGFVDGITVGISIKEQLQLEIGNIIAKLTSNKIKYDDAVKEISNLFEDPDVKEDDAVTTYYKQAWLGALDDYKPDPLNS